MTRRNQKSSMTSAVTIRLSGVERDGKCLDRLILNLITMPVMNDVESVNAWQRFLAEYAVGGIGAQSPPPMPPVPPGLLKPYGPDSRSKPWSSPPAPLYSSAGTITLEDARAIRDYYCKNHYLPPPRSPLEHMRQPCINAYNLYDPKQLSNIKAATDLIVAFFPQTICTFSLMEDHEHNCFCVSGDKELVAETAVEAGQRVPSEDSLCSHAALYEGDVFYSMDLQSDWRYRRVPMASSGFKGFIGSTVSLKVDPVGDTNGRKVVVGTLNICFVQAPPGVFTDTHRSVVLLVTSMLETQLQATWKGDQCTKEGQARILLSALVDDSLININMNHDQGADDLRRVARTAVSELRGVLSEVESIALLNTDGLGDHVSFRRRIMAKLMCRRAFTHPTLVPRAKL